MIFSNKIFDLLKWLVLVAMPALTSAFVGLCTIYGWPYADEVAKTSAIVCTLLGTLLGISNLQYKLNTDAADKEEE